jgi:hypothetical protein
MDQEHVLMQEFSLDFCCMPCLKDTKIDFDRATSVTVATVRLTSTEKRKLKTPRGPASQLSTPTLQQFDDASVKIPFFHTYHGNP